MNDSTTIPEAASARPSRVPGVLSIDLPVINDARGSLSFGQCHDHLPFQPQRYFVVYGVPQGQERGGHAHRSQCQFLACVKGAFTLKVDDGTIAEEFRLSAPSTGIFLPPYIWSTQTDFTPDAVLLVLVDDLYSANDYICDYSSFLELRSKPIIPGNQPPAIAF